MAKAQDSGRVVIVYGEPFAGVESPTRRDERAQALVAKAMGTDEVGEKRRRVERFKEAHDTSLFDAARQSIKDMAVEAAVDALRGLVDKIAEALADPMDRVVDGLTVRECLERFEQWQRTRDSQQGGNTVYWRDGQRMVRPWNMSHEQVAAARTAWSLELKRKAEQSKAKERAATMTGGSRE